VTCQSHDHEVTSAMPKKTFHNLPTEKREKIVNAAIDEFAE
jgi:hypothetical protein